jgi:acetoacetate decarboxylase
MIPGAGGSPLAELIEDEGSGIHIKEFWTGTGSCHFTGVSVLDPWHKLPIRQMVSSWYCVTDSELTEGRVLERLP